MIHVTLDTNIYVSALEFAGIGNRFLGMAAAGKLRIDISRAILDELVSVLRADFKWNAYSLHFARLQLVAMANLVEPTITLEVVAADPHDNRILECAVAAGSDFIVTQDKDLFRIALLGALR